MKRYASKTKLRLNGKKLVHLRAGEKLTQDEAAKKAQVSTPTYKNAEAGCELQAANAGKIAEAFGVSLEELEMVESHA